MCSWEPPSRTSTRANKSDSAESLPPPHRTSSISPLLYKYFLSFPLPLPSSLSLLPLALRCLSRGFLPLFRTVYLLTAQFTPLDPPKALMRQNSYRITVCCHSSCLVFLLHLRVSVVYTHHLYSIRTNTATNLDTDYIHNLVAVPVDSCIFFFFLYSLRGAVHADARSGRAL